MTIRVLRYIKYFTKKSLLQDILLSPLSTAFILRQGGSFFGQCEAKRKINSIHTSIKVLGKPRRAALTLRSQISWATKSSWRAVYVAVHIVAKVFLAACLRLESSLPHSKMVTDLTAALFSQQRQFWPPLPEPINTILSYQIITTELINTIKITLKQRGENWAWLHNTPSTLQVKEAENILYTKPKHKHELYREVLISEGHHLKFCSWNSHFSPFCTTYSVCKVRPAEYFDTNLAGNFC